MKIKCLFIYFLLLAAYPIYAQVDTKGTDFWVSFGRSADVSLPDILQIRIVADQAATGTITFTEINGTGKVVPFSVAANSVYNYTLSIAGMTAAYLFSAGISSKTVRIQSDVPVTAYAYNQYAALSDATNLLPVPVLGTDYYHLGRSVNNRFDQFMAIATQNNTDVYVNGTLAATLAEGEVYFFQSASQGDLSGYHITSNYPIAYFSAHNYCVINGGGDNFFQQLTPVNTWGKNFLVPVTSRELELIRIIASQNNTTITQTGGTIRSVLGGQNSLTLQAGQWVELEINLSSNGCYIQSNEPIQVCSYMVGMNFPGAVQLYGDESLVSIPPIEQSVKSALVSPFVNSAYNTHSALIVTPTATKLNTTIQVGSNPPEPISNFSGTWYDNTASGMSFFNVQLTNSSSSYIIRNDKGIVVYGYGFGYMISYYYMAASAMRTLEASFYVNEVHNQDLESETFCPGQFDFDADVYGDLSSNTGFLKWYIDNVEETAARDQYTWSKTLPAGAYQVKIVALLDDNVTTKEVEATLEVSSCMRIVSDFLNLFENTTDSIAILTNDTLSLDCADTVVPVITVGATQGTASIVNKKIVYTPQTNFVGFDSLTYSVTCGATTVSGKVYFTVKGSPKLKSQTYIGCPNAVVILEVDTVIGYTYRWYDVAVGGSIISTGSSRNITKDNTSVQSVWVSAYDGSVESQRVQVDVLLAENCGVSNPVGCATSTSLIWKEDFDHYGDGLNPASPILSTVPLPAGMTTYIFGVPNVVGGEGRYALPKYISGAWTFPLDDHTSPTDRTIGRSFVANGRSTPDRVYQQTIDGLCVSSKIYFSFWLEQSGTKLKFTVYASNDSSVLASFYLPSLIENTWRHYGFFISVPPGVNSIYFDIWNYETSGGGNDFVLDDIEIRLCSPPVTITAPWGLDTSRCSGSSLTMSGTYTDDGTFGDTLTYRWEHSKTNADTSTWTAVSSDSTKISPINATHFIPVMNAADTGYYRLVVSKPTLINMPNCRAVSAPVHVGIAYHVPQLTQPANDTLCAGKSTNSVTFSGTDVDASSCIWVNDNPAIGLPASGTGNISSFMATNTTNSTITGNITVTPVSVLGCTGVGTSKIFTIMVKPKLQPSIIISVE